MANLAKTMRSLKEFAAKLDERRNKKEAAMEEKKIKIQDKKDMSNVQGAKDGGRMGYRMGGKCKLAKKGKGRAYGKNS
jgi:hypothetical protein